MAADDPKCLIAQLSVDCINTFRDKYPDNILQAFTFTGKYMTIAALDKTHRYDISTITKAELCPLCQIHFYKNEKCKECVLYDGSVLFGCGNKYNAVKNAAQTGTFIDVAFNISKIVGKILNKKEAL